MVKKIGRYELGKTLGKGAFSKVKYGVDVETGEASAIKIIDKAQLAKEQMEEQLKREIAIMKHLKHEHIIGLKEVMQTSKHIYIVLDLVTGGELFDRIVALKRFDENVGRKYFQQLVGGLYYCHQQGIAHRDLKPENLLLDAQDRLKISDFGLSNLQRSGNDQMLLQTVCGTPNYVAPEVLKEKGYNGFTADVWSCGVILFVMLAGYLPFDDPNMNALFNKIERGEFRMAKYFSPESKDLIAKLLVVNPAERLTLEEVTQHPWFQVGWDASKLKSVDKVIPSASDISGAMSEAEASEAPGNKPGKPAGKATGMDAFDILFSLTSGSLNPLVSTGNVPRATRFMARGTADAVQSGIIAALEKSSSNPKQSKQPNEIKGFINSPKGLMTYHMEIRATVSPKLHLVDVRRTRGDILEFNDFFRNLLVTLGPMTNP